MTSNDGINNCTSLIITCFVPRETFPETDTQMSSTNQRRVPREMWVQSNHGSDLLEWHDEHISRTLRQESHNRKDCWVVWTSFSRRKKMFFAKSLIRSFLPTFDQSTLFVLTLTCQVDIFPNDKQRWMNNRISTELNECLCFSFKSKSLSFNISADSWIPAETTTDFAVERKRRRRWKG